MSSDETSRSRPGCEAPRARAQSTRSRLPCTVRPP